MSDKCMKKALLALCTALALSGCSNNTEDHRIKIFVDSGAAGAVEEVIEGYKEENLIDIDITAGSTSRLLSRIENGAECDIFIPSSKAPLTALENDKLLNTGNSFPLLTDNVVLITSYSSDTTVKSFDTVTEASSLAIARENEPVGSFAREILINLNVYKKVLNMKTNTFEDSNEVISSVANGKSEVGICFESGALSNADKVRIITRAPRESLNSDVLYSVALINDEDGAEPSNSVKSLYNYLDTPEAAQIFAQHEFGIYIGQTN